MKFLGLLVESPLRSSARASLLRHASFDLGHALRTAVVDAYEARRANEAAEAYVTHTLLTVGSRRMGSCLRGEPWCDEMSGSVDVKRAWAAYRARGEFETGKGECPGRVDGQSGIMLAHHVIDGQCLYCDGQGGVR